MARPAIVAGQLTPGVWCPSCNAPVRIRIALHHGTTASPVAAYLEVCVSCGHHYMPSVPVVAVTRQRHPPWSYRPRPVLAWLWWLYRRQCARDGLLVTGCALPGCPRPGWHGCCTFEPAPDGRIRWVFCGRRHRARFLASRRLMP